MKIIIVGAGEVGSNTAADLSSSHEITVVEKKSETVESLKKSLDILAIQGDGTSRSVLEEAGIEECDLFIAATDSDEINIVASSTAKTIKDIFTICRIKNSEYLKTWQQKEGAFGVDFMVCQDLLAAKDIVNFIGIPTASDLHIFADGIVQMAQFQIPPSSPIVDKTISEADVFDELTFAAILREGDIKISRGNETLNQGDDIIVIGTPESIQEFGQSIMPESEDQKNKDIVIVGGSEIGSNIAHLLEDRGIKPRLIEKDPDLARTLAEDLPKSLILQNDATNTDFLSQENIGDADILISALDKDEKNLLVSLLSKQLGELRTITIVENAEYTDLFEKVGVDVAINPRKATSEEITRFTVGKETENIAVIESGKAEVIEIQVDENSVLANTKIEDSVKQLPEKIVIGAIIRNNQFITPRGKTVIEIGDKVVVFVDESVLDDVINLL